MKTKLLIIFLFLGIGSNSHAQWPKITIKKPKITIKKPKITIKAPKVTIKKPTIKADVIGDLKNPTRIVRNVVKVAVEKAPGGDLVVNIVEETLVKPSETIVKETEIFINNAGKELERGWENGTIQTIAIAVASYYIAGPVAFELVGWKQIAGATIINLAVSELTNIDTKTADITEKAILDVVEESNKAIEPIINDLKNALCTLSGVSKNNCSFNFLLKAELSDDLLVGMDENLKSHYAYYKKTYDNALEFQANVYKHRKNHLRNYNLVVSKGVVDPILSKMLESSKQFFTTMTFSSDLIASGNFSDLELANLMGIFNDASINYYATNYIFSNKNLEIAKIGDVKVKNILSQWTFAKDGIDYIHHDLIDNYISVQTAKDYGRAPSSLKYLAIGGIFIGAKIMGNFYHGMNHIENIQYYKELIYKDVPTMAKYNHVYNILERMQISTAMIMTEETLMELPNIMLLYGRVTQGKKIFKKKDFFDFIESVDGSKFKEEASKLDKLIKDKKLPSED